MFNTWIHVLFKQWLANTHTHTPTALASFPFGYDCVLHFALPSSPSSPVYEIRWCDVVVNPALKLSSQSDVSMLPIFLTISVSYWPHELIVHAYRCRRCCYYTYLGQAIDDRPRSRINRNFCKQKINLFLFCSMICDESKGGSDKSHRVNGTRNYVRRATHFSCVHNTSHTTDVWSKYSHYEFGFKTIAFVSFGASGNFSSVCR